MAVSTFSYIIPIIGALAIARSATYKIKPYNPDLPKTKKLFVNEEDYLQFRAKQRIGFLVCTAIMFIGGTVSIFLGDNYLDLLFLGPLIIPFLQAVLHRAKLPWYSKSTKGLLRATGIAWAIVFLLILSLPLYSKQTSFLGSILSTFSGTAQTTLPAGK